MNKHTELSDFEINKKVADKLGLNVEQTVVFKNGGEDIKNHSSDLALMKKVSSNRKFWKVYDPCNNPSDAMPIIIENDIAIFPAHKLGIENWCAASGFYDIGEKEVIWGMESNNKNPLRAAMEVYLLMKDAENE